MSRTAAALTLALALLTLSCSAPDGPAPAPAAAPGEGSPAAPDPAIEASAAVVRALLPEIRKHMEKWKTEVKALYISFEGDRDPDPAFLARFADFELPVRAGSLCHVPDKVRNLETGEIGILVLVEKLEAQGEDGYRALGSFLYGNQGGLGYKFELRRTKEGWVAGPGKLCVEY